MYESLSELSRFMLEAQAEMVRTMAMICALITLGAMFGSLAGLICLLVSDPKETRQARLWMHRWWRA